jgi:hypothetical protein
MGMSFVNLQSDAVVVVVVAEHGDGCEGRDAELPGAKDAGCARRK